MNIIVVGRAKSKPFSVALHAHHVGLGLAAVATVLLISSYVLGAIISGGGDQRLSLLQDQISLLSTEIHAQRAAASSLREESDNHLDAMALQVGELQARATRLDALGQYLTEAGKLNDGEFDFSAPPAIGGPETDGGETLMVADVGQFVDGLQYRFDRQELQLEILSDLLRDRELAQQFMPSGRPVSSGWISSRFGKRIDPFTGKSARHKGIDFSGKKGADVLAVADGVVVWSGRRQGYGIMVEIDHGNGYVTRYAHNQENLVDVGQRVHQGELIAKMGSTGRATGPNVHFEVLNDGNRLNPKQFLAG